MDTRRRERRVHGITATNGLVGALVAMLLALLACGGPGGKSSGASHPKGNGISVANSDSPGERFDLDAHAVKGKTTLFEFYSARCAPCGKMQHVLEYLEPKRPDVVIRQVDIDRSGSTEIDFESPLAQQYEIESLPSFRIYDENGALAAQGKDARDTVSDWYSQAQMIERADQDPGMRNIMQQYESHDGK